MDRADKVQTVLSVLPTTEVKREKGLRERCRDIVSREMTRSFVGKNDEVRL